MISLTINESRKLPCSLRDSKLRNSCYVEFALALPALASARPDKHTQMRKDYL